MADTIILYESPEVEWMGPPTATRPVWDLPLGPFSPAWLLGRALPGYRIGHWAREAMGELVPRSQALLDGDGDRILLDARLLPVNARLGEALADLAPGQSLEAEGTSYARRLSAPDARDFLMGMDGGDTVPLPTVEASANPRPEPELTSTWSRPPSTATPDPRSERFFWIGSKARRS